MSDEERILMERAGFDWDSANGDWLGTSNAAVELIRLARAQEPQQEPVLWRYTKIATGEVVTTEQPPDRVENLRWYAVEPLYTAPQPAILKDVLPQFLYCSQCGQGLWRSACGPTHAARFAALAAAPEVPK